MGANRKRNHRVLSENLIEYALFSCASLSVLVTIAMVLIIGIEALSFFKEVSIVSFLTDTQWTPLFFEKHFGVLPLLLGTVLTSLIAILIALPMGLVIAVYLSEYANPVVRKIVKPVLEILTGIPTIVYGYFALFFITPLLQLLIPEISGFNALSPGLVMGFMILPMVASLSEDALYAVPRSLKEGAYALGATRLQVIFRVLVPAALGGIIASFILAISRAIGETMIVAIAAGQQPTFTFNPLRAVETMTTYIVQISLGDVPYGTLEYRTIFAVAFTLFLLTFSLNWLSLLVKNKFRNKYI